MAEDDDGPVVADSPERAETRREFESAVALAKAEDNAAALASFLHVLEMPELPAKGYDSCIANVAICAHRVGDRSTALFYAAMCLDSASPNLQAQRVSFLELFFSAYKGQIGMTSFYNPYNEYE
jgi:hypothetical protein